MEVKVFSCPNPIVCGTATVERKKRSLKKEQESLI
jgi:hypothetical protein